MAEEKRSSWSKTFRNSCRTMREERALEYEIHRIYRGTTPLEDVLDEA